jgi:hypothetical protein
MKASIVVRNLFALMIFAWGARVASAQDTSLYAPTIFTTFQDLPGETPLLTLNTDIRRLINRKHKEEYQPAELSYAGPDEQVVEWSLRTRPRGNRRKDVCVYPPLKLKWTKSSLNRAGLQPFNEVKMVNQCRNNSIAADYLLKEYLAYRLYNVLSPASIRARLAKVRYVDPGERQKDLEMYAIFLEPVEEMAARLGGVVISREITHAVHVESEPLYLMTLFQYMIGNTDYNLGNQHNMITVKLPEYRKLVAVPYDFDYCGMVSADYAVPHEALPIKDVRQRYHKGPNIPKEELDRLIEHFKSKKDALIAACEELEPLSSRATSEALDYLDYFFKMLDSPRQMEQIFAQGRQ